MAAYIEAKIISSVMKASVMAMKSENGGIVISWRRGGWRNGEKRNQRRRRKWQRKWLRRKKAVSQNGAEIEKWRQSSMA
jgi:hypothetical protein